MCIVLTAIESSDLGKNLATSENTPTIKVAQGSLHVRSQFHMKGRYIIIYLPTNTVVFVLLYNCSWAFDT